MNNHKACFYGEIWIFIHKLWSNTHHICFSGHSNFLLLNIAIFLNSSKCNTSNNMYKILWNVFSDSPFYFWGLATFKLNLKPINWFYNIFFKALALLDEIFVQKCCIKEIKYWYWNFWEMFGIKTTPTCCNFCWFSGSFGLSMAFLATSRSWLDLAMISLALSIIRLCSCRSLELAATPRTELVRTRKALAVSRAAIPT